MAHPNSQVQLGSKQNCAQCSPGSAVAQLGVKTAGDSVGGSVALWGTKEGLHPAIAILLAKICGTVISWHHYIMMWDQSHAP